MCYRGVVSVDGGGANRVALFFGVKMASRIRRCVSRDLKTWLAWGTLNAKAIEPDPCCASPGIARRFSWWSRGRNGESSCAGPWRSPPALYPWPFPNLLGTGSRQGDLSRPDLCSKTITGVLGGEYMVGRSYHNHLGKRCWWLGPRMVAVAVGEVTESAYM